jgi:hypothetical protein
MTDTAEYWNDIKSGSRNRISYAHKAGIDCGHFHSQEFKKWKSVSCPACLRLKPKQEILLPDVFKVNGNYQYFFKPCKYVKRDSQYYYFATEAGGNLLIEPKQLELIYVKHH